MSMPCWWMPASWAKAGHAGAGGLLPVAQAGVEDQHAAGVPEIPFRDFLAATGLFGCFRAESAARRGRVVAFGLDADLCVNMMDRTRVHVRWLQRPALPGAAREQERSPHGARRTKSNSHGHAWPSGGRVR